MSNVLSFRNAVLAAPVALVACAPGHAPDGLSEAPRPDTPRAEQCNITDVNAHYASAERAGRSSATHAGVKIAVDGKLSFVKEPEGQYTKGWGYGDAGRGDPKLIHESISISDTGDGVDRVTAILADVAANDAGKTAIATVDLVEGADVQIPVKLNPNSHGFVVAEFDQRAFNNVQIQGVTINSGDASLTLSAGITYEEVQRDCSSGSENNSSTGNPGGVSSGGGQLGGGSQGGGSVGLNFMQAHETVGLRGFDLEDATDMFEPDNAKLTVLAFER